MPWLPAAGVPARVAVPLPLSVKVTPDGSAPDSAESVAAGEPVVVTVNVPAVPAANVVRAGAGDDRGGRAGFTVRVKLWVALGLTPFAAVIVIG